MISTVFWTTSGKFAFQYVLGYFRVYNGNGDFVEEFWSFEEMVRWLNLRDN